MTTSPERVRTGRAETTPGGRVERGDLLVAALVAVTGTLMLLATVRMDVSSSVSYLGPRFFPGLVAVLLMALGAALVVQVLLRARSTARDTEQTTGEGSDRRALGIVLATLTAHLLLLETAGWIIAGALLFWGVSYALGGRKVLRDLGVSFLVSATVQLAFSAGLGLTLPPGVLVGVV
ncbi:putative tricarboxylic transport membrane protein [Saccharopolyspora lacisalsi]|uniref:Putative tricarboxylic transport membrane protein n=1 Tax=Halosaccharopolyspora lacisalsi TaxID=1000566 RepID=A0A839DXU6_9PSEU|nr:tripartite tricarboxylate transporter TctB family protein [Halosaccharopolyspora lacisalsi]MBA8823568.1 putative tricarboxylic transport membrane protein [Halosaccharopolyspora lacisalsi]